MTASTDANDENLSRNLASRSQFLCSNALSSLIAHKLSSQDDHFTEKVMVTHSSQHKRKKTHRHFSGAAVAPTWSWKRQKEPVNFHAEAFHALPPLSRAKWRCSPLVASQSWVLGLTEEAQRLPKEYFSRLLFD